MKRKPVTKNNLKTPFSTVLKNLRSAISKWNESVDEWNEQHPEADQRQKVKESHVFTLQKIYLDFANKYRPGTTRVAKLRVTHSNLKGEYCLKTVYNHILRLVQAGLIKKTRAVMNFSNRLINCIELKLDEKILGIDQEVDERLMDNKPLVRLNLNLSKLNDIKRRTNQTLSFGDLFNSLKHNT